MARRRLLHHPAGYMRQGPIGLLHDENVRALKAMRANDGNRLATARMKWIEDPILRSLIPGIMSLSRPNLIHIAHLAMSLVYKGLLIGIFR